jgi:hypothetical protein
MKLIGEDSDALIVAGDAFDVLRNLDPRVVESKSRELRQTSSGDGQVLGETSGPGESQEGQQREIKLRTAQLWDFLDFKNHDSKEASYPYYIDALMFMGLMVDHYSALGKPIYYIIGNHEGYEAPYGISPRILHVRANAGIPSDQNLTFYEATLLFGKKYSYLGGKPNFKKKNLEWAYRWITPWKDCLVNPGKKQNFLLMGWDDDEDILSHYFGGGGTLPRAGLAVTDHQLALLKRMTSQEGGFNLMASHFTYANFDLTIPLQSQDRDRSGSGEIWTNKTDTGTFKENRKAVYAELTGGKVKLTISGHSHRGGAYTCFGDGQIDGLRLNGQREGLGVTLTEGDRALKSVVPRKQFNGGVACLVSGSGGLYSYQNLGNSELSDIEKPQGMVIKCDASGNINKVKYVRDKDSAKPRLAVRCDYLLYEDEIGMFYDGLAFMGEIVVADASEDSKYRISLNPEWLRFLNDAEGAKPAEGAGPTGGAEGAEGVEGAGAAKGGVLPISHFTLHFLNRINYQYFADSVIKLEIASGPTYTWPGKSDVPVYKLTHGPREVKKVLDRRKKLGGAFKESEFLYFLSVHFNSAHPIGKHYDLSSPWCYPVVIEYKMSGIRRKIGRDGELPNYGLLKKIPEYNPTEDKG